MHAGFIFTFLRLLQLLSLIPIWSLLAVFVSRSQPDTPPQTILFLFIVAILATVWAAGTLLMYRRMLWTPLTVAVMDFVFFALLVAGVVLLAPVVRWAQCMGWEGTVVGGVWRVGVQYDKSCLMLKSAWGLGILDVVLFFGSTLAAWAVWHGEGLVVYESSVQRRGRGYTW